MSAIPTAPKPSTSPGTDSLARCGVLLTNLGTPDAPSTAAVRRYLGQFLSDRRVVDLSPWLWRPILHGVILRLRPPRSAKLYQRVWTERGSPLLVISERQRAALAEALAPAFPRGVSVALGMRYGRPSIAEGLEALRAAGANRLLVLPAYPQNAASTIGSTFDALADALRHERALPEIRFVNGYATDPGYIDALAASVRAQRERQPAPRLLMSFHGIPQRYVRAGDPYQAQCEATANALAEALGLGPGEWALSYQSRVGREPWLQPYTDELLVEWARSGVRSVQVICPGFSADCLETIDEIDREAKERFVDSGAEHFDYIPALNDSPAHIGVLRDLVLARTADWREA